MIKIIKNQSGETRQILNRDIPNGEGYNIPAHLWLELTDNTTIHDYITSGDYIVNDGNQDLSAEAGILHCKGQLEIVNEPIQVLQAIGENAPSTVHLNSAAYGFSFEINEELYTFTNFDNIIGSEPINIQLHMAIDNSEADRWIQFEYTILTTTGVGDKQMNTHDAIINTDKIEVPTTPYLIFDINKIIPAQYFSNNEDNLFLKIKRIECVDKIAPTDNPILVRMDKRYKRRIDT